VNVLRIIEFTANERVIAKLNADRCRERAEYEARVVANLMQQLKISEAQAKKFVQAEISPTDEKIAKSDDHMVGKSSKLDPSIDEACSIKHPYIGFMTVGYFDAVNTVLLMLDMGPTLAKLILDPKFRADWLDCSDLRSAFFTDVGQSALNLVELLDLCHNDIRPSNITMKGSRFCLIDFDNCRGVPSFRKSPLLNGLTNPVERKMIISVAQIALVVFKVEHAMIPFSFFWDEWIVGVSTTETLAKDFNNFYFDDWVSTKKLEDIFTRSRAAGSSYDKKFMDNRLQRTLGLLSLAP
jgi:hypothetical protein